MELSVTKTSLNEVLYLRNLFLQENNFQIRYNASHERGWTDSYIITFDTKNIGYGSIKGNLNLTDRDTVFEFYTIPAFRKFSSIAFLKLLHVSKAIFIECQSNDFLLSSLMYEYGMNINSDVILFEDSYVSEIKLEAAQFRERNKNDIVFEHKFEPVGDFVLELNKEIVASGGFTLYYNIPFADLYMEVKEDHRRKGLGSLLYQELKKQCYLSGRVPAARTSIENIPSRATLLKAGLKISGFMLLAQVKLQL